MESLWQDIKYGRRMLARSPGFTAVVIVILAVGIGANAAIFSVVYAVMLRPLPYRNAHRLVFLYERTEWGNQPPGLSRFLLLRQQNQVFDRIAGTEPERPYVTGIDHPRQVRAEAVSPHYFPLLDVRWMVLKHGLKLILIGIIVGITGALALTRVLSNLLYEVTPTDLGAGVGRLDRHCFAGQLSPRSAGGADRPDGGLAP